MPARIRSRACRSDTFVFLATDGKSSGDVIQDFEVGRDRIDVSAYMLEHGAEDISLVMADNGLHIVLDTGHGGQIDIATLKGSHDMLAHIDHDVFII